MPICDGLEAPIRWSFRKREFDVKRHNDESSFREATLSYLEGESSTRYFSTVAWTTILVMTIRGDSKRIAKMLNQRETVKLRALAMWSESGERLPYNPQWAIEPSDNTHNATNSLPNFGAHSPLGSGEWIAPWNVRWSVPTK